MSRKKKTRGTRAVTEGHFDLVHQLTDDTSPSDIVEILDQISHRRNAAQHTLQLDWV